MDWIYRRLKELKIRPQKKWGQNFLVNQALSHQMVQSFTDLHPQKIVEVGPGLGSLTELLIPLNNPLLLIEVDSVLCEYWKNRGCQVLQKDALKSNLDGKWSLISSLPFHIASTLILKASMDWNIENMVVMVQKEVGDRVLASPKKKDYGFLSVISQSVWGVKYLTNVQENDFFPAPNVQGQILVFYKKNQLNVDIHKFSKFVKICFSQKRKLLKKKLLQFYDRQRVEHVFAETNSPPLFKG